jgi:hypothetical protein
VVLAAMVHNAISQVQHYTMLAVVEVVAAETLVVERITPM